MDGIVKRRFFEFILKLINFFLTLTGLFMVVYGLNHLVKWKQNSVEITQPNKENLVFARRLLLIVHQSNYLSNKLPSAWFPSLLMAIGATLFIISCFGCVGTTTRNRCCLSIYSVFLVVLILVEIGLAAFVFADHKWEKEIPNDKTGCLNAIHNLMNSNWKIMKWIALGAVILEALALLLALYLRFLNQVTYSRHDDEFSGFQQPVSPTERKAGY